ncbi:MAG: GAF domain-containing protein [Paracoccus sp. (in: a-proteobacteria)]|nr:GAF domain-containing protein [Paracoccus sp. (in: a-proteobacteria)]
MTDRHALTGLNTALTQPENQPEVSFRALQDLVQQTVGARLFTIMEHDATRHVARRSWTNMPDVYPVTGEKPMLDDRWTDIVVRQRRPFVANSIAELSDVFDDHALISSLGCASCLNLPVFIAGAFRGSLNCLDVAGHYTPERVAAAAALVAPAVAVFLLADSMRAVI